MRPVPAEIQKDPMASDPRHSLPGPQLIKAPLYGASAGTFPRRAEEESDEASDGEALSDESPSALAISTTNVRVGNAKSTSSAANRRTIFIKRRCCASIKTL